MEYVTFTIKIPFVDKILLCKTRWTIDPPEQKIWEFEADDSQKKDDICMMLLIEKYLCPRQGIKLYTTLDTHPHTTEYK